MTLRSLSVAMAILAAFATGNAIQARNSDVTGEKPAVFQAATAWPSSQNCSHRVGNLWMTITNWGFFGSQFNQSQLTELYCLGPGIPYGSLAPSAEYPAGSGVNYLYQGALWIGAVVDQDTLVSVGADGWQWTNEMYPEAGAAGELVKRSNTPSDPAYDPHTVSNADYIAVYYDTLVSDALTGRDPMDNRPHIPLGLKIVQESYSWGNVEYEDFIIFRYRIKNIGVHGLYDLFVGLYMDADVWHIIAPDGFADDISGSYAFPDSVTGDSLLVGWSADNDGDPSAGEWTFRSPRGVLGVSLLDFPTKPIVSFNWWASYGVSSLDWGPRRVENGRDFGTGGLGTPEGDRNKYYVMSRSERDYDQMECLVDHTAEGWLPPNSQLAAYLADGYDTRFLLSFGPKNLDPGDSAEFAFVVAMGDNFHRNPDDFQHYFDANNPQPFYNTLNFSDLKANVLAARRLYESLFPLAGDANGSGQVDLGDVVYIVNYIFAGGAAPSPLRTGDVNGDCRINLSDAVYLIAYIFADGTPPVRGCVE